MNIADIILLLILLVGGVVTGLRQGFIYQAVGLIALILGAWISYKYTAHLASLLAPYINLSAGVVNVLAFAVIFLVAYFVLYAIGMAFRKIVRITFGGWIDKLLGVAFALCKIALILGLLILLFDTLNGALGFISQEKVNSSVVYVHIKQFTNAVFPYLKTIISKGL